MLIVLHVTNPTYLTDMTNLTSDFRVFPKVADAASADSFNGKYIYKRQNCQHQRLLEKLV